jgi:hypothetical protein
MRRPRLWALGLAPLVLAGCGDPQIVPVVMPGSNPVIQVAEGEEAVALGEGQARGAVQPPSGGVDPTLTPIEPTAEGEPRKLGNGLEVTTLKAGTGDTLKAGQTARVHYVGTLENGSKFDSSRDKGQPFPVKVGVGQVIRGWDVGLPGMKVGELRRLKIPHPLAYGEQGQPPVIPPRSTLIFEVELIGIE